MIMRKKILLIIISIFLVGMVLSGCSKNKKKAEERINIVVTRFPEYDFSRAIVADKMNVQMLTPPGSSTHSFDPSPSDIIKVQKADIFIYVGGESDIWVKNILGSLDTTKMKIIRLMDYIDLLREEIKEGMQIDEEEEVEEEDAYDEHIWTSPKNAMKLINIILEAICEKDPANANMYKANAKKYQDELKVVDEQITNIVNNAKRKKIIIADKFPFLYFVKDYGLDYEAAFPGCSDQADAGAKTIAFLINAVKNENIPCIYYVELSNKNVAAAISEEAGVEMFLLNSCHNVSKTDFDNGVTYLLLMQQNVENLKKGLN